MRSLIHAKLESYQQLLSALDIGAIERFCGFLDRLSESQGTLYCAGNGGSAATCDHIENDFSAGLLKRGISIRSKSLMSNSAVLTAIANDLGFEHVISHQLKPCISDKDGLLVISASGNSVNLINGVLQARKQGAYTFGWLGFDGGKLSELVDDSLLIPTLPGEYGAVESLHMVVDHLVYECYGL